MGASYTVVCVDVNQSSSYDDCRCIEYIGFKGKTTDVVRKTPAEAYEMIDDPGDTATIEGTSTELEQATRGGTKYVRTQSNDTMSDNLLQQDSC